MRKLFTFLLTMVVAIAANAALVAPTVVVGEEFKSVASLDGKTFAIINKAESKALYGSNNQNLGYADYATAFSSANSGFMWQLESLATNEDETVHGYYLLHLVKPDGTPVPTSDWGGKYLNSQNATGWCCFNLGTTAKKLGQDIDYGAVWDVQYEEGKGFSLKNVGTALYKGADTGTANKEEAAYFMFAPVQTTYVPALKALIEEGAALKAKVVDADAVTAYEAAIAGINPDAVEGDGLTEAKKVDAAITVLAKAFPAAAGASFTRAIINPSFEVGSIDGWTSKDGGGYTNNGNFGKATGGYFVERWKGAPAQLSDGTFLQEVSGLPNGTYKLTAEMQNLEQKNDPATNGTGLFLVANEDKTECLEPGTVVVTTTITDGKLSLGAKLSGCTGNWICFDNFQLTLVEPATPYVPEKDAWYTGADFFHFRADKDATEGSPYYAYKNKVEPAWGADPENPTNGCIVCKVPANPKTASQIWIRGTEAGQTIAKGSTDGFKVTFRVKADGEYKGLESQAHNNWGYKTGGSPFGTLDVTTEWQTVTFICTGEKAKNDFTDLCFNISGDTERTFYFDDVQISRGSEWYLNNDFHAKDYLNGDETYSDGANPHPVARYNAEEGCVEVKSNAGASQTYNSQLWIAIPQEFVGTMTKMTMEVQATKAITCPESFQATATGNGWGCNPGPGKGVEFKVGEWTTIERVLNTKNVKSTGTWKNLQADQYCLDLSDVSDAKEAVVYQFKNVKFEAAYEEWYTANPIYAKNFAKGTETYENGTEFPKAPYVFGNGDEGGYAEVVSNKEAANDYDSQIFFEIPEALRGKSVRISMKAKASKEITVSAQLHSNANGTGWGPAAAGDQVTFTVGEWTEIKRTFNSDAKDQNGNAVAYYVLNLSEKGGDAITYDFDEVAFDEYIDWGELEEVPVEGTLLQTQDWTAQTSYGGGWNILNENTTLTVKQGEGLIIENKAELETPYTSQFFVADGFSFEEGKQYAVRYTVKVQGEGSIRTDVNHWGDGVADDGVAYTNGYKQYVFVYGASPVTNNGYHVIFQPGKFVGKIILEKVELFDITPKYDEMEWTDNLFTNGDVEGEDMSAFIAKVNSDVDALLLPASTQDFKGSKQVVVATVAREKDAADETKYLGNDHDTQFFVRLPYALPKGTLYYFSVDYISNKVADVQSQTHSEPGDWKSNTGVGKITTGSEAQTLAGYFTADNDMRTIAFNLASAVEGGKFFFDNFIFKVVATSEDKTDLEDIKAFTAEWDKTSLWDAKFALNVAYDNGRNAETEGCTEESVKALDDAMAAGKAILQPAEGAEPATKDAIAAAAKTIEDAIAGLEKGGVIEDCDLTADMFFTWDAVDATASKTGQAGCAYDIEKSTGMPYGDGSVNEYNFADLTAYDHLAITATEGEPRLLFNRAAQDDHQGPISVELPRDFGQNKYEAVVDNGDGSKTYVINLKAITEKDGYAHLHAIKGANWQNTTVTAMKLFVGASEYSDVLTNINGVEDGASVKDGKYIENGQIVIVKGGKKYTVAGVEIK